MKKTEKKDLRTKSVEELKKILKEKTDELNKVRLEKEAGKIRNTKLSTIKRKEIATILTIIAEKKFQEKIEK